MMLYDTYFVLAAIFLAASFAFMTWQLATVNKWLAVFMLPLFMFGFYTVGKGVYDHLGYATTKWPDSVEILLYDYNDPLTGYTFMFTLEPVKGAKPRLRALKLTEEQKEKKQGASEKQVIEGGFVSIFPSESRGVDFEQSTLGHLTREEESKEND